MCNEALVTLTLSYLISYATNKGNLHKSDLLSSCSTGVESTKRSSSWQNQQMQISMEKHDLKGEVFEILTAP